MARPAAVAKRQVIVKQSDTTDIATRSRVEAEAAGKVVQWARQALEVNVDELAHMLDVSDRTIMRWEHGESGPAGAEQRLRLRKLYQLQYLTESVFRKPHGALRWFHTPLHALQGRSPVEAMEEGSIDDVIGLLAGLQSGAAV